MKRTLIMMMVIGSMAFGRDFEVREANELNEVMNYVPVNLEALARERGLSVENIELYSDFHRELDSMNRGTEDR